jgi:hypothetical protein
MSYFEDLNQRLSASEASGEVFKLTRQSKAAAE